MPGRKTPLVTGEIYHVLNRGIASQPVFLNKKDYQRKLDTLFYYQPERIPLRYSFFIRLPKERRSEILNFLKKEKNRLVDIIVYCLMPNHFHLLVKQLQDNGISHYMSKVSNSYTRYFNVRSERVGPIYQGKFKAVRIENENQLLHVQRYIHLNPYSSYVVNSLEELKNYPYSSLSEYLNNNDQAFTSKELIFSHFKDILAYNKFVFDHADYQRELERIKHLTLES